MKRVTGLGNIYAVEALFLARINPQTTASELSRARVKRLHQAIITVLSDSIAHGSTMNVNPHQTSGNCFRHRPGSWETHDLAVATATRANEETAVAVDRRKVRRNNVPWSALCFRKPPATNRLKHL